VAGWADLDGLNLPTKADDVIRAIDEWRGDQTLDEKASDDERQALTNGLKLAETVNERARRWISKLKEFPVVGGEAAKEFTKPLADLDTAQAASGIILDAITGKGAAQLLPRPTKGAASGSLRTLMVATSGVIRAWVKSVKLLDGMDSIIPGDIFKPVLELGKQLADALVRFAAFLRALIAGAGIALLIVLFLLLDNRR